MHTVYPKVEGAANLCLPSRHSHVLRRGNRYCHTGLPPLFYPAYEEFSMTCVAVTTKEIIEMVFISYKTGIHTNHNNIGEGRHLAKTNLFPPNNTRFWYTGDLRHAVSP